MATATLSVSAVAPTGLKYTTFVAPNISDTPSVAYNQFPVPVATDMVIFRKWATKDGVTTSYSVTVSTNGIPSVFSMSDSSSLSFLFFFWDESTSAYGSTATYGITEYSSGAGVAYLPVHDIFEWLYAEGGSGNVMKRTKEYLNTLGYTGNINKMMFNWLRGLGYTGTLTYMIDKFERDNTDQHG